MKYTLDDIKQMLRDSQSQEVIGAVNDMVSSETDSNVLAMAYYLRGNAYRQQGNVRTALNSFLEAMALDPTGPAAHAYRTMQEILGFYDHDLYNP